MVAMRKVTPTIQVYKQVGISQSEIPTCPQSPKDKVAARSAATLSFGLYVLSKTFIAIHSKTLTNS